MLFKYLLNFDVFTMFGLTPAKPVKKLEEESTNALIAPPYSPGPTKAFFLLFNCPGNGTA